MTLQEIHNRFFSFRNGIVAKTFHDAGDPHPRIFGLQLPQLAEIARECGYDNALAETLWAEKDCRESRLMACYLSDPATIDRQKAEAMANDTITREEADILAWRLLRKLPYASELQPSLSGYIAAALSRNLQ